MHSSSSRLLPIAVVIALVIAVVVAGCDVLPAEQVPVVATMDLSGVESESVHVSYSTGADLNQYRDLTAPADTLSFRLPVKREFDIRNGSFAFTIERLAPGHDGLSVRIWADDFLFVDLEALPDTQRVLKVYYRHDNRR